MSQAGARSRRVPTVCSLFLAESGAWKSFSKYSLRVGCMNGLNHTTVLNSTNMTSSEDYMLVPIQAH